MLKWSKLSFKDKRLLPCFTLVSTWTYSTVLYKACSEVSPIEVSGTYSQASVYRLAVSKMFLTMDLAVLKLIPAAPTYSATLLPPPNLETQGRVSEWHLWSKSAFTNHCFKRHPKQNRDRHLSRTRSRRGVNIVKQRQVEYMLICCGIYSRPWFFFKKILYLRCLISFSSGSETFWSLEPFKLPKGVLRSLTSACVGLGQLQSVGQMMATYGVLLEPL